MDDGLESKVVLTLEPAYPSAHGTRAHPKPDAQLGYALPGIGFQLSQQRQIQRVEASG